MPQQYRLQSHSGKELASEERANPGEEGKGTGLGERQESEGREGEPRKKAGRRESQNPFYQ